MEAGTRLKEGHRQDQDIREYEVVREVAFTTYRYWTLRHLTLVLTAGSLSHDASYQS